MGKNGRDRCTARASSVVLLACALVLLAYSDAAGEAGYAALKLCASVIVPSLFPYMVISSLLVLSGAATEIGGWFARPVRYLFHLPGCAGSAFLLGALCGFPVGAKTACELHENGSLTRQECERLIAIANNTGPSFVIEVVGAHLWGSRGMGLTIYLSQIASAVLIGWVDARRSSIGMDHGQRESVSAPGPQDRMQCLSLAISSSARAVLSVCGFIVFFGVASTLAEMLLARLHLGAAAPYISALLEFSGGAARAADLGGVRGAFLTGFAVGWSGISIFAQCKSFTAPHGIGLGHTALCKGIQGILVGASAAVYEAFFFVPSAVSSTVVPPQDIPASIWAAEILILAAMALFFRQKSAIS